MTQLMPLPLTVSCFSKIQIGFTFLVPAHPGSPGQRAVKRVCVCAVTVDSSHMTASSTASWREDISILIASLLIWSIIQAKPEN